MEQKYDYLIVGAGLYGAVCAQQLSAHLELIADYLNVTTEYL